MVRHPWRRRRTPNSPEDKSVRSHPPLPVDGGSDAHPTTPNGRRESPQRKSRRLHAGHASTAVLAVLTSAFLLNGCTDKAKVGGSEQAAPQVDQAPAAVPPATGYPDSVPPVVNAPGPVPGATSLPDHPDATGLPQDGTPAKP